MQMRTTEHIALGVQDIDEAANYYVEVFGFKETGRKDDYVELTSGVLKLYITQDDGYTPTFNVDVRSIAEAEAHIVANGGEVYMRHSEEVFVKDKYGHCFCLSKES